MPELYVQTRINLLTALREIDRESKQVSVSINVITPEDNASVTAEKYGVVNQNGVNPASLFRKKEDLCPGKRIYILDWFSREVEDSKPSHFSTGFACRVRDYAYSWIRQRS